MARDDSPPPSPRLELAHRDGELYRHMIGLVDGVTKGAVTSSTTLVTQYDYTNLAVDNTLLQNLTRVALPTVRCQLKLESGELLPPTLTEKDGYYLEVTYNKLLIAPTIRLHCQFVDKNWPGSAPYLTTVVEWHFNDHNGSASGIEDYSRDEKGMEFTAGSATSAGFNNARLSQNFSAPEWNVCYHLKTFLGRIDRRKVHLSLSGTSSTNDLPPPSTLAHGEIATVEMAETRQDGQLLFFPEMRLGDQALPPSAMAHGATAELGKIFDRLPMGTGLLLPSIGCAEYAAFADDKAVVRPVKPKQLMSGNIRHPMVPLDISDTFSTVKEASVQLVNSATVTDAESREALELWVSPRTSHQARLHAHGNFAALGVQFGDFEKLGSINDEVHYRLPRDMHSTMVFQLPGSNKMESVEGFLMGNTAGLPAHHAIFLITSRPLKWYLTDVDDPTSLAKGYFDILFKPRMTSATYDAQLATICRLHSQESSRWHGILLNQLHTTIPELDLTANDCISASARAEADEWLLNWMSWNTEQMQVISGISRAKGGMMIVMGPAGTGKTLLQQALAIYFWKLGYHILALAPANSNADHMAKQMDAVRSRDTDLEDLKFCRLYPSSRDFGLELLEERELVKSKVRSVLSFSELLVALEERRKTNCFSRPYGCVEIVVRMAEERKYKLNRQLRDDVNKPYGLPVDAWEIVRDLITAYKTSKYDPGNGEEVLRYRRAYNACKAHIIALSRFMITTTGNVRAAELLNHWTSHEYGGKCIGVMVFVDEAAKDVEANVWGGIVCESWDNLVKGTFLFGDDKQLQPTNVCSKDKVQFGSYNGRLDVALPCRLVREGFPHYRLFEQRRMHHSIAAFPNEHFYEGKLRNGPGTGNMLDNIKPGLRSSLEKILMIHPRGHYARRRFIDAGAHDDDVRLVWIEVEGRREHVESCKSMIVKRHVAVFFHEIFPILHEHFKQSMEENVMIICAYSATLYAYRDKINELLRTNRALTAADMPRVLTVDASQGEESFMVVFDGSLQNGDVVGFMKDPGRCNVAVTRAKEVFWIIGGDMRLKFAKSGTETPNHMTKYHTVVEKAGQTYRF